jgi:hypothetical protein
MTRLTTRVCATLISLALLVMGVLVALEIVVGYYFGHDPLVLPWRDWYDGARNIAWSDRRVVSTFIGVALLGIVLLTLALWRRRPTRLVLDAHRDDICTDVNRRGVERTLVQAAQRVDGVSRAGASVRRRNARLRVVTNRRDAADLDARVRTAAIDSLASAGIGTVSNVSVTIESRGDHAA